jgi:hypothetical protein
MEYRAVTVETGLEYKEAWTEKVKHILNNP